jgi:hypothetical protein
LPGKHSNPSTPHPGLDASPTGTPDRKHTPSPTASANSSGGATGYAAPLPRSRSNDGLALTNSVAVDAVTVSALDAELEASLEWISHPAVFSRDSRKAVLQAIGVISSQRAFTFRTPIEGLWASRVGGVKRLTERSREWREEGGAGGEGIIEES